MCNAGVYSSAQWCLHGAVQCVKGTMEMQEHVPRRDSVFRGKWQPLKNCPYHREKQRAKNKQPNSRKCQKRARNSEAGKASAARALHRQKTDEKAKQMRRDWKKTQIGKACGKRSRQTPAGKARTKRNSDKQYSRNSKNPVWRLKQGISNRIRELLRSLGTRSVKVSRYTSIESGEQLKAHIESTFPDDGSMHWGNWGHRGDNVWNIGHRIAQAMYDPSNADDMRRCWSLPNMFAQWSIENQSLTVSLPDDNALLSMRNHWPLSWNDKLPTVEQRLVLEKRARNVFGMFA